MSRQNHIKHLLMTALIFAPVQTAFPTKILDFSLRFHLVAGITNGRK